MAEYIHHEKMPGRYRVIVTSDWHVGSKGFHDGAAAGIVARLKREKHTFMLFNGDAVEGKKIDSPHFNPEALHPRYLNIKAQFDYVADLVHPVREKVLAWGRGNHDEYLSRDFDVVEYLADKIGVPRGGYQTWVNLAGVRVFMYHGWAQLPRGAKDVIQRDANQRAWLVNRLAPLASDVHAMFMGHTHALLVQPPVQTYGLLSSGRNVRAHYFTEPEGKVSEGSAPFVPQTARWYASTGTLRRSGGFGYVDYAERAGYSPAPIGYVEMAVDGGRVTGLTKVVV